MILDRKPKRTVKIDTEVPSLFFTSAWPDAPASEVTPASLPRGTECDSLTSAAKGFNGQHRVNLSQS